nr:hypothetical protein [Mycolicibacterium monacense]
MPLGGRCGTGPWDVGACVVGGIWVVISACRGGGAGAAWVRGGVIGSGGGAAPSALFEPPAGAGAGAVPCIRASRSTCTVASSGVCAASGEWKSRS